MHPLLFKTSKVLHGGCLISAPPETRLFMWSNILFKLAFKDAVNGEISTSKILAGSNCHSYGRTNGAKHQEN